MRIRPSTSHAEFSLVHRARRWTAKPISDDVAFEAIKAGVDSMPPGVKMFLNSGQSDS